MNKLLLNQSARNHIKFFPMKDTIKNLPESEAEQINWASAQYKKLQESFEAKRLVLHKNVRRGYLIAVWELDGLYYLIQSLKNEFGTFNNTIYISNDRDDLIGIAKFLKENIETIMTDYREQILDARDALLKEKAQANHDA